MAVRRITALVATLVSACALIIGCDDAGSGGITDYDPAPEVLNIVAGSEHRVVFEQIVRPWCAEQKLTCTMTELGSVDQARMVDSGDAPYDAFWFASSVFQELGDTGHRLQRVRPMFSTPLVYAGRKSELDALGFTGREVAIEEILGAVEAGRTTVWMTNPTQSNSGATVLMAFLSYFAGNGPGEPLTREQLDSAPVRAGFARFAAAFAKTPPSTGLLMDECLAEPQRCKTLFTYEDLVIERNRELVAAGQEPLDVIYPKGALAIADAPLGYFPHGDNPEKAANFERLQDFLLSGETQQRLVELGRRPITSIGLSLPNAPANVFDPARGIRATLDAQPITLPAGPVIEAALEEYQTRFRPPTDLVYCIDASGSMRSNEGWDGVLAATDLLFDPVQAKRYLLQAGARDRTAVLLFDNLTSSTDWSEGNSDAALRALRDTVHGHEPGGETGVYRCLESAVAQFGEKPAADQRKRLVILMTDGMDTEGGNGLQAIAAAGIPVVAIGFGDDADEAELRAIAERTGGSYLTTDDLVGALRQATGYR